MNFFPKKKHRLLPLLFLLIATACLADSGAYRVEVIILRNLHVEAEPTLSQDLNSYSKFPSAMADQQSNDIPDDLHLLQQRSSYMDDVWRRLRASANYRPLLYAAWEQNRTDFYPPMRLHNEEIVDTQLRPPTNIMVAELGAEDPLAAYRSTFYQLDGNVQLKRSRFLHLFLDLEIREPPPPDEPGPIPPNNIEAKHDEAKLDTHDDIDSKPTYAIFGLKQNRQVSTGKVQYFDTPYFGALVFVSTIAAK